MEQNGTEREQLKDYRLSKRWTPQLAKGNFTAIPEAFLENYAELYPPITSAEAMLIIHLLSFKWDEKPPFPGYKILAKRLGISTTAARNHARSLQKKGYLRRIRRVGETNQFDLIPLFEVLEQCVKDNEAAAKPKRNVKSKVTTNS